ncbi:MAG TPA: glycosyltransferase [Ferruginibacter sp.]|jgi:glycosyltransferase involved in cell wall biosynthesis|nr:glycosyltransferase [Ferruginibacter sp.]
MNDQPLVSVLMTSYNREKYIEEAIKSVLSSTYTNFELIIVDDCSKDRTVEIAKNYAAKDPRIKVYVNEQNLGDYPNRNKAASYAKGKYIKYLDADDLIYYYGLEVMVNYMERYPEAGFGLSSVADHYKPFPIYLDPLHVYLEHYNGYGHLYRAPGSSIIRLDAFNEVGGFSGERMIGDIEFWFRIARYYSMVKFPAELYWSRIHEEQESKTDYAKKHYPKLTDQVEYNALRHTDCPLPAIEKSKILKKIKHRKYHRIIKRYF